MQEKEIPSFLKLIEYLGQIALDFAFGIFKFLNLKFRKVGKSNYIYFITLRNRFLFSTYMP